MIQNTYINVYHDTCTFTSEQCKTGGRPADLLTNQTQTVWDQSPWPHLEGAACRDQTHNTTRCGLLLYQLDQLSLVHTFRAINMHSTYDVRTMSRYRRVFQVTTFSEMYKHVCTWLYISRSVCTMYHDVRVVRTIALSEHVISIVLWPSLWQLTQAGRLRHVGTRLCQLGRMIPDAVVSEPESG